jgi:hypothetical protein
VSEKKSLNKALTSAKCERDFDHLEQLSEREENFDQWFNEMEDN